MEISSHVADQRITKEEMMREALKNPYGITRELNNWSFYHFLQYFWPELSANTFQPNWHIEYLCKQLEQIAERVANKEPKAYDLIINISPGTTKTVTCSIAFPAWCWTKWHWMKFITASYSKELSMKSSDYCRDLLKSPSFARVYPDIGIREDRDTKTNFEIVKRETGAGGVHREAKQKIGGGRYSTSVGGTLMGFHGDILIVDDPLNPTEAASEIQLGVANHWMEQTLPTRKTNKDITPTILIMQRLHQFDPTGAWLAKEKKNVRHICMPGEIRNYRNKVNPPELIMYYKDDLFDVNRMSWTTLKDLEADLGQYGYAGQIGQNPTPPGGGMFKVDNFVVVNKLPFRNDVIATVRYWDKAGISGGKGPFTAGVKMSRLVNNKWLVEDVVRGRWATHERERKIRQVTEADGIGVDVWIEQEPGSGGLDSVKGTIENLAGFVAKKHKPSGGEGDKVRRADAFSVQVNNGAFQILNGAWNHDYIEELRFFPFGTYKDQVDSSSGAFSKLVSKKIARRIT